MSTLSSLKTIEMPTIGCLSHICTDCSFVLKQELQKANTPSDKMGESKRRGRPPKIKDKTTQAPVPGKT